MCLPLVAACAAAETPAPADELKLDTDNDKILYSMGLVLSRNISGFEFTADELDKIVAGIQDGVLGREPRVDLETYGPQIQAMVQARMESVATREKEAAKTFVAEAAAKEGAETTASGLVYRELQAGDGPSPGPTDRVRLHYHGTLRDGSVFDSSREGDNPEPAVFPLNAVVPCFSEGVQKMKVGGKAVLTCPPELAWGDHGSPPKIKPGAAVQFEVELLEILKPEDAGQAPGAAGANPTP
jgi:FKBP-type peptidyl-prolyl cis-trans isomerase FkpA/FKBP-type peptidyl-prolyl cis-trans isomerase FklB